MKNITLQTIVAWLAMALWAGAVAAAAPRVVNYQGRLTDGVGNPVANGNYTVTFAVYNVSAGGAALWSETQTVTTSAGSFTVLLGSVSAFPSNLFDDTLRWLGTKVGADPEMVPRARLASVPFALSCASGWTDGGTVVRLTTTGDSVGVGTASPSGKLGVSAPDGVAGYFSSSAATADSQVIHAQYSGAPNRDAIAVYGKSAPADWWGFGGYFEGGLVGVEGRVNSTGSQIYSGVNGYVETAPGGSGLALRGNANGGGSNVGCMAVAGPGQSSTGVQGSGVGTNSTGGYFWGGSTGVHGVGDSALGAGAKYGIWGEGRAAGAGDLSIGVFGQASGPAGAYGVFGWMPSAPNHYAGYFNGDVTVYGTLSKSAGSFKIDHPLDPDNKYLQHSFVESPDMKNIYDGVVTLDANGSATVTLPDWFEALNKDFRYQLTCIGGYAPVYISSKVSNNAFVIAGGSPNLEVSWMVTGIRKDAYANANRIQVEVDKQGAEHGKYLYPELFGAPKSEGIHYEMSQQIKAREIATQQAVSDKGLYSPKARAK